jgi:hypothetical protein
MSTITPTMRIAAVTISAVNRARDTLVEPSRALRKTAIKPRAAPVRNESSTWVTVHVSAAGCIAKKTADPDAAALRTRVANRNAGRPLRALPLAT